MVVLLFQILDSGHTNTFLSNIIVLCKYMYLCKLPQTEGRTTYGRLVFIIVNFAGNLQ